MGRAIVVSLGGNALLPADGAGTIGEQLAVTQETLRQIVGLARTHRLVLTHGNGPVVGNILIRNEAASQTVPPMPLDICGADSQGGLGYMIQQTLQNLLRASGFDLEVVSIVTQVVVDRDDPGFDAPTKPIGPFYSEAKAKALAASKGWKLAQDSGRGWRRVVPSPRPRRIVEMAAIRTLFENGHIVIAAGGGGIPVVEDSGGALRGIEAVIDKDLVSVELARGLGIETLLIVTAVDQVALDFGTPRQRWIDAMSQAEARRQLEAGQFPPGSMGPKIQAAIRFLQSGGREVLITGPAKILDALEGRGGTWITRDGARRAAA